MVRHIVINLKVLGAQDAEIEIFSTYAALLRLHGRMLSLGTDKNITTNSKGSIVLSSKSKCDIFKVGLAS